MAAAQWLPASAERSEGTDRREGDNLASREQGSRGGQRWGGQSGFYTGGDRVEKADGGMLSAAGGLKLGAQIVPSYGQNQATSEYPPQGKHLT